MHRYYFDIWETEVCPPTKRELNASILTKSRTRPPAHWLIWPAMPSTGPHMPQVIRCQSKSETTLVPS
jgi:hypothetical protein